MAAVNAAQPPKMKRYRIEPNQLAHAHSKASRSNIHLIGIYHSHPDAPVDPSRLDFDYALPNFTYIVISLQAGEPRDIAAWVLNHEATAFELDELKIF